MDCALLGPSYQQDDRQNCRLLVRPGTARPKTFLKAIGEFGRQDKTPRAGDSPVVPVGHSGGGFWAS